jgi:hypothetical protein
VTLAEVATVLVVLALLALVVLAVLPGQRENARMNACRRNLMQIGLALALYDRSEGALPTVPRTSGPESLGSTPLKALLESFVLPDLTELTRDSPAPEPRPGSVPGERPVRGFTCPSDTNATALQFPAPVSYRATAGDRPDGVTGAFAPGRRTRLAEIEAGDGLGYTAAFAERLVGNGRDGDRSPLNYAVVQGPIADGDCGALDGARWRGDAGSSWVVNGWRTALYHHALTPNAAPSCIAADSTTAWMGASSGHVPGVNVLIFDGSVRTVSPTVAAPVWRALASTHSPAVPAPVLPIPNRPSPEP